MIPLTSDSMSMAFAFLRYRQWRWSPDWNHQHGHGAHTDLGSGHSDDGCRRSGKRVNLDRDIALVVHEHVVDLRSSKTSPPDC